MGEAFDLEISATIDTEVDVPWNSRVTVFIFHRHRVIGKKTLRDSYIIPDENNKVRIRLESLKIRNLKAFEAFFRNMMPKDGITQEEEVSLCVTAALDHDNNGHEFSIAIDLDHISKLSVDCLDFQRCDESVRISFNMLSPSPVDLDFGHCRFILRKGKETLAFLDGYLIIQQGHYEIDLEGDIDRGVDRKLFAGTGTLAGFKTHEHNNSFLAHAIRLFEIQVKLK
ncbi:hypothetical protein CCMA1212_002989 [Trichoderma ghanense]|uniref:Uncharacterized protein n=1 Tax=Trichoderma ghanense TaxID=65468 RepID=A0ABY2HAF1_9HYPO